VLSAALVVVWPLVSETERDVSTAMLKGLGGKWEAVCDGLGDISLENEEGTSKSRDRTTVREEIKLDDCILFLLSFSIV
jgi:hypothetical protein